MAAVAILRKDHNSKHHGYEIVVPLNPRVNPVLKHDRYGWESDERPVAALVTGSKFLSFEN
ncbi:hypothetical protein PIB30_101882, partial [Stylosanthes scabra]|nr:hypothetical protein [Stylosanthes scabra]